MDRFLESFYLSHVLPFLLQPLRRMNDEDTVWVLAQSYRSMLAQKAVLLRKILTFLPSLRPLLEKE